MSSVATPRQPSLWGDAPLDFSSVDAPLERLDEHSFVLHQHGWLLGADAAFERVEAEARWRALRRPMYDRVVDVPRLVATASLDDLEPDGAIAAIARAAEGVLGVDVEHVGLNLYRSGDDSVAWHRDRIGDDRDWSLIALVSLGGPRDLQVRRHRPAGMPGVARDRRVFTMHSGDLLIMGGACQRDWEHAVRKVSHAAPRISLALRSKQFPQGPHLPHAGVTPWRASRKLQ